MNPRVDLSVTGAGRCARLLAAVTTSISALLVLSPASSATAEAAATDVVTIAVDSVSPVSPVSPASSGTAQPLTVMLTLTNRGTKNLSKVAVEADRGDPITTESALQQSLKTGSVDNAYSSIPVAPTTPVTLALAAGASAQLTFPTTTSVQDHTAGICLCHDAVYPLFFSAHVTGTDGSDTRVGTGLTYIPVAKDTVPKNGVGWIWPLMDRPHRLLSDTVFEDDLLAGEVAAGGRLDRALAVVEALNGTVPLTLIVDPETIDELAVMAAGTYQVSSGRTTVPGTGAAAAAAWLERLHQVLANQPAVQVQETPYADPDVQSLTESGLDYDSQTPAAMAARVSRALDGSVVGTGLAWPGSANLSTTALSALVEHGNDRVVLDATQLRTGVQASAAQPGAVRLRSGSSTLTALLTTSRLTSLVASAVTLGNAGAASLPDLLAELTVRVTDHLTAPHVTLLAPPRYVDPDVGNAVNAIRTTSTSTYTAPASLSALTDPASLSGGTATLRSQDSTSGGLPDGVVRVTTRLTQSSEVLTSLLTNGKDVADATTPTPAQQFLATLPSARQRLVSTAWAGASGPTSAIVGTYAQQIRDVLDQFHNGVYIVAPSNGTYTLASGTSDLPITVANELNYPVYVSLTVSAVGGLPGLNVGNLGTRPIAARSRVILRLPTTVDRAGRLEVEARLSAPNGDPLGQSVPLTLRSTSLGTVGVIIMIVAGALLVAALARRWVRSARSGRTPVPAVSSGGDGS